MDEKKKIGFICKGLREKQIAHKILLCGIVNHSNILRACRYLPTAPYCGRLCIMACCLEMCCSPRIFLSLPCV